MPELRELQATDVTFRANPPQRSVDKVIQHRPR